MSNEFKISSDNLKVVKSILTDSNSEEEMHKKLDILLNTTRITYKSVDDYNKNFPKSDDLEGKINLIISRRK